MDIKPRARHHFLVIPKQHISNTKHLTRDDHNLVLHMKEIGVKLLSEQHIPEAQQWYSPAVIPAILF